MAIYNVTYLMEQENDEILNENAKEALQKVKDIIEYIKPHPELSKYIKDISYAKRFLSKNTDIKTNFELENALDTAIEISTCMVSILSISTITLNPITRRFIVNNSMGSKKTIPIYIPLALLALILALVNAIIKYASQIGMQYVSIKKLRKLISYYDKAIELCDDDNLRSRLIENKNMIERAFKDLNDKEGINYF